jgi:hypothetical protein
LSHHLALVAFWFRLAGWVIGVPSLLTLASSGGTWLAMRLSAPPPTTPSPPPDIGRDGAVAILEYGARGVGAMLEFIATIGEAVIGAITVASLVTGLLALLLYAVGRGIDHHSMLARIAAILISLGFLLCALMITTSAPGLWRLVALPPLAISLYALWVLCLRFA